ncbi:tRNA 2'-phosphotransferase 1 [Cytospora paraplurivora]|uniref:tRNA 2'-phosphotransferase 1 n=1 Tax=Cytospora paraplurivora TaxID=2898453 RepID=A0AAN9U6B9_9PEZI
MNNSTYRAYEDGDNSANAKHRYRSLRALEGHTSTDSSKDKSSPIADEETLHTIESENTADIFMNIAGEDSSSIPRQKPDEHFDGDHNGPVSRVVRLVAETITNNTASLRINESQHTTGSGAHHEASESSNSTAAPSTVWDELDELKSRIHRLELTGKMPRTSGAAMSRASDERPPTAGTGATTLSGSPKRASGTGAAPTEIQSTTSSARESQPILKSALSKTKPWVSSDVYNAMEAAANDALSLSQMMGAVGQPGPISSGASTIGGGGSSTVTDRQLRKKTDSICRSLTELCLALTDEGSRRKNTSQNLQSEPREIKEPTEQEPVSSPPPMKIFSGISSRRGTINADEPLPSVEYMTSPRPTRLEKRASTTFNFTGLSGSSALANPRYASSVLGDEPTSLGRKSSLVIARTRRGVTEEPDDQGRKTSLLRTRRAGTEGLEEGRKASYLLPQRRLTGTARASDIDEEPESRFRVPSRAITELGALRVEVPNRDREDGMRGYVQGPEPSSANSALPRRRLLTSHLPTPSLRSSRLSTPTTPSARRFFEMERSAQQDQQERQDRAEMSDLTERLAEERGQRQYSSGPSTTTFINRASINRKRHSGIPSFSGTASNVGGYR